MHLLRIIVLLTYLKWIDGARILGLFPTPSLSHQVVFRPLMEALARRGHHLVVLTTDPVQYDDPRLVNLTQIDAHYSYETFGRSNNFAQIRQEYSDPQSSQPVFYNALIEYIDEQLSSPEMKRLIEDPNEKFDMCIIETFAQPLYAFKDRFNCSLIIISSLGATTNHFEKMGNPWHPMLYSHPFSLYVGDGTFWQRLYNLYQVANFFYTRYYLYSDKFNDLAVKHFGNEYRHIDDIEADADMLFLTLNPLLGDIRPTVPAILYTGSLHIRSTEPLPQVFFYPNHASFYDNHT
jgi:glucuronosyltransferase